MKRIIPGLMILSAAACGMDLTGTEATDVDVVASPMSAAHSDVTGVTAVRVTVTRITARSEDATCGRVVLSETRQNIDLVDLAQDVFGTLEVVPPPGIYKSLRLVLAPNAVATIDGDDVPVTVSCGNQNHGFKIKGEFTVTANEFPEVTLAVTPNDLVKEHHGEWQLIRKARITPTP